MAGKPKPVFWVALFVIVAGLISFAIYRAGVFVKDDVIGKIADSGKPTPTAGGKTLDIQFYSSSAKRNWVDEMVDRFNRSGHRAGGRTVKVTTYHVTSGGSFDDLKTGKIRPDIWSPGDESWLRLAAAHWKLVKQSVLYDDYQPLVNIPLIIAMWDPMAKVLGHPGPIGWKDIAKVAADPEGWAALGHPEWGKFRWGHAHPDANSGFLTIISEVYAALEKTDGITAQDLSRPEVVNFLREFEGAVEHYGLSNSWIDDLMHVKGPSYLSACVQYENTIIQTNEKHQNRPFKLTAIYPTEGNFWTQHPAAALKESWMTPEKEAACQAFISFLLSEEAQMRAMEMGLRPILDNIKMTAPFDEAHGVNPTISADKMFQVPEESVLKRIRDLWEEVKVPATVILVVDRSASMKGQPMENARAGAIEFVKSMKPRDQLMISVFNQEVTTLTNLCPVQDCGESAVSRLASVFADGNTALYDAVHRNYALLYDLVKKNPKRRYSILLLSDGKDTASKINRHDFLDSLPGGEDYDVPKIYTIAYGGGAEKDLLAEIANRSNARLFTSSPEEIQKTYKELSANF